MLALPLLLVCLPYAHDLEISEELSRLNPTPRTVELCSGDFSLMKKVLKSFLEELLLCLIGYNRRSQANSGILV